MLLFLLIVDVIMWTQVSLRAMGDKVQSYVHENYEVFRDQAQQRHQQRQIIREERNAQRAERRARYESDFSWNDPIYTGGGAAAASEDGEQD